MATCTNELILWPKFRGWAHDADTLTDIKWDVVVDQVWTSALWALSQKACAEAWSAMSTRSSDTKDVLMTLWEIIVRDSKMDTLDGLHHYISEWAENDERVKKWLQKGVHKNTADLGGWLADYCYSRFLTLSGQAEPNILYKAVHNSVYELLGKMVEGIGPTNGQKVGDIFEQLCCCLLYTSPSPRDGLL